MSLTLIKLPFFLSKVFKVYKVSCPYGVFVFCPLVDKFFSFIFFF